MRPRHPVLTLSYLVLLAGCELLGGGDADVGLRATPAVIVDSAFVGHTNLRAFSIALDPDPAGETVAVSVARSHPASWLTITSSVTQVPATLEVAIDPTGLAVGDHVDTIRVFENDGDARAVIPVLFRITVPEHGTLTVTPAALVDSVLVGEREIRWQPLTIGFIGAGAPVTYGIHATFASNWIHAGTQVGQAPGGYTIGLDARSRTPGIYIDTLTFSIPGSSIAPVAVPVRFTIRPCPLLQAGAMPVTIVSTLTASDCVSPRHPEHYAKRYRFTATAGDTLMVSIDPETFGAELSIERPDVPTPLFVARTCPASTLLACVHRWVVAETGDYVAEVTTWGPRDEGGFTLSITRGRAPDIPHTFQQIRSDLTEEPVPFGGGSPHTSMYLIGQSADPDGDSVAMQVELRPVGTPFTGTPTHIAPHGPGTRRLLNATALPRGVAYRWRARSADNTGRVSAWVEAGGNAADATDFYIGYAERPNPLTGMFQRTDSGVAVASGDTLRGTSIVIGAFVSDSSPTDSLRLRIRIGPHNGGFDSEIVLTGAPVPSGSIATVRVTGLQTGVAYSWRAWAVDRTAQNSSAQWFESMTGPHFIVRPTP